MPRASRATDSAPSKIALTTDEFDDLQVFYNLKTREARRKADAIKAELDVAREEVGSWYSRMHADLRYTRKEFEAMQADQDLSPAEFLAKEAKRTRLYQSGALKPGDQLEFDLAGDTITDQQMAVEAGRRAYLANQVATPPKSVAPIMHQDWLKGWQAEQEATAARMSRAEAFIAKRAEPKADEKPVDLNGEDAGASAQADGEGRGPQAAATPDPDEVKRQADALKKSGFADKPKANTRAAQKVLERARADEAADRAAGQFEHAAA